MITQPGCAWASGHVDQGGGGPGANEGGAAVPTYVAQRTYCSVGSGFEADVVVRSSIRSSPGAWPTTSARTGSTKCSPTLTTERRSPGAYGPSPHRTSARRLKSSCHDPGRLHSRACGRVHQGGSPPAHHRRCTRSPLSLSRVWSLTCCFVAGSPVPGNGGQPRILGQCACAAAGRADLQVCGYVAPPSSLSPPSSSWLC